MGTDGRPRDLGRDDEVLAPRRLPGHGGGDHPLRHSSYAASFQGRIEAYDGRFKPVTLRGDFSDPAMTGLAPYNVAVFGNRVYVAWFDPSGGPGGEASVFRLDGTLVKTLSAAPSGGPVGHGHVTRRLGGFGGSLLVGNVGDGRITALDPQTGAVRGSWRTQPGSPSPTTGRGAWPSATV